MNELKPCPFCGSEPNGENSYDEQGGTNTVHVGCPDHECLGWREEDFASCHEADEYFKELCTRWNTRFETPDVHERTDDAPMD